MEINWYGQSCFKIKGKSASIVIDPFKPDFIGLKFPKDLTSDVVLSTHNHDDHNNVTEVGGNPLIITGPGEYEKSGISINGIASFHDEESGQKRGKNTIYHIYMDDINLLHLGDLGHALTDEQTQNINTDIDILMIPVGNSYTINAEIAAKVVAQLEPKIVIPMHYQLPGLKVELADVSEFLKEMGAENVEPLGKLVVTKDKLPAETTIMVLNKN